MAYHIARKIRARSFYFWAFGLTFTFICCHLFGCTRQEPKSPNAYDQGQSALLEADSVTDHRNLGMSHGCRDNQDPETPVLYAHFLEQSLSSEISFEDILNNRTG